jgi:hypothetical protein
MYLNVRLARIRRATASLMLPLFIVLVVGCNKDSNTPSRA